MNYYYPYEDSFFREVHTVVESVKTDENIFLQSSCFMPHDIKSHTYSEFAHADKMENEISSPIKEVDVKCLGLEI